MSKSLHQGAGRQFLLAAAALLLAAGAVRAATFTDDFAAGLEPFYWRLETNQPLYTVDDTAGQIRLAKPSGGDTGFQYVQLRYRGRLEGDFDVSVAFREAQITRVNGQPGNQVQLNAVFGGVALCVVRSDEVGWGHNRHVWMNPPSAWYGAAVDASPQGTLRLRRVGVHVEAYLGASLIWAGDLNAQPVTTLALALQNNGTSDATSVVFDDFQLTADGVAAVDDTPIAAAKPRLSCYPNPFNPRTTVRFDMPASGRVRVCVYDVTGSFVRELVDGDFAEGSHETSWDGQDGHGRPVATGTYLVRLFSGGAVETMRMSLVR
jgi:hypothetical protein